MVHFKNKILQSFVLQSLLREFFFFFFSFHCDASRQFRNSRYAHHRRELAGAQNFPLRWTSHREQTYKITFFPCSDDENMEGSDDNASESSRRWTCSACGCNTNTESDRNCTICGTSNGTSSAFVDSHQQTLREISFSVVAAYVGQYQRGARTSFEKFSSVLVVFLFFCVVLSLYGDSQNWTRWDP